MRISFPDRSSFNIPVEKWTAKWDSGITWKRVGRVYHPITYGAHEQKWSSTISVREVGDLIVNFREKILKGLAFGWRITVYPEEWEHIYGPEFGYGTGHYFVSVINPTETAWKTGKNATDDPTRFTFTISTGQDMTFNYLYPNQNGQPEGLRLIDISRKKNGRAVLHDREYHYETSGFGYQPMSADLTWEGERDVIAKYKTYLQKRHERTVGFVTSPRSWVFFPGVDSGTANLLSITDNGPLNQAATEYRLKINLAYRP